MLYKHLVVFIVIFFSNSLIAQRNLRTLDGSARNKNPSKTRVNDTLDKRSSNNIAKNPKAKIEDYKIISIFLDTTYVDTTLSIQKDYKFNYLRKDYFELLPFNNMGQTYNTLTKNLKSSIILPSFGSKAKHYNYMEKNDINYYHVPTPLTELMFKSNFVQGQLLDAFFTVNTSEQFNFSIAHKGMRSLGKYQHILSSTTNFRFTTNYHSKDKRYYLRSHLVSQSILNQENGGLSNEQIIDFETGNPEFTDRSLFDPLFEDAESNLEGRRFYVDHTYLLKPSDSLGNNELKIGNVFHFEDKYFQYKQQRNSEVFGEAFNNVDLFDKNTFEHFYTEFNARFNNTKIGALSTKLGYSQFNYGYNSLVFLNDQIILNRLKENALSFVGEYENRIGPFNLTANLGVNIAGNLNGNFLNVTTDIQISDDLKASLNLSTNSKVADYNYRLYQSDYINYNWYNNFRNETFQKLKFDLDSNKFGSVSADFNNINNYLYFENKGFGVKPYQFDGVINYMRIKYEKEVNWRKFSLYNTVMYQNVFQGSEYINVPEINTRHSIYYSDHLFKKAMYLQTGITLSYFSKYNMNAYDPVLAEFYVQNEAKLGGFPRLDLFVNAKIQQTRIFLKAEHFNSSMTGYNFYSAPNYPYRDFIIRFGIVWNFFL